MNQLAYSKSSRLARSWRNKRKSLYSVSVATSVAQVAMRNHLPVSRPFTTTPTVARSDRRTRSRAIQSEFEDLVIEVALVSVLWLVAISCASFISLRGTAVERVVLFGHLISLVVGFGAVVMVDAYGLLWLLGRRTAAEVVRFAATAHVLISAGVVGLLVTGSLLGPNLSAPLPRVKAALVLVVLLNGVNAHRMTIRLRQVPGEVSGDSIPWWCIPRSFLTAVISQAAWWGAILIGFLTTMARAGR